jgi:DNA-binding transcriptional LysR family regulator
MEHLRGTLAFITAARKGSFSAAARELDLSPQAVATSIARLETALGARLFNRTTRSIALTDEGQSYLARAQVALAALDEAARSVRDHERAPQGVVRVTSGAAFGRRYVLPLLPGFMKHYPGVCIELSMEDRKVDLVREGFDVALRGGTIKDSSLITRRISKLAMVCVASPAYLRKHGAPISPNDLHAHRIIALRFSSGASAPWEFRIKGAVTTFETAAPALVLSDSESVGDAAVLGVGIARVSLHFAWPHLQAGRLKLVLLPFNDPGQREMVLHYPHREFVAPRVRAFVEYMLQAFSKDPSLQADATALKAFAA